MVDISRETYEKNGLETIVDGDGILWLDGKRMDERLDYKNLRVTTVKYLSDHRKNRYKLFINKYLDTSNNRLIN